MADSRCCSPDSEADDVPRCDDGTGCSNSESEAAVGPNAASVIDALDGCLIRLRLALERAQAHSLLPFNVDALIARLGAVEEARSSQSNVSTRAEDRT